MIKHSPRKGFTLVELLVVIGIISLLAVIAGTSYTGALKKARIAKRVGDLQRIKESLDLYYIENKSYPVTTGWQSECSAWGSVSKNNVIPGLVPTYLSSMPSDPSMSITNSTSCYLYYSNGADYKLLDHNITEFTAQDYASQATLLDSARDNGTDSCTIDGNGYWAWQYSSKNGRCW